MERKQVVTSFLQYNGKILVLKRSEGVHTMKGRWAGVSGYLEEGETTLERAYKEIGEEVGLDRDSLKLIRDGEAVEAPDLHDRGRLWVVHPFLFQVTTDRIRLDWEHDDFRWIAPDQMDELETVPFLKVVLHRVLD